MPVCTGVSSKVPYNMNINRKSNTYTVYLYCIHA